MVRVYTAGSMLHAREKKKTDDAIKMVEVHRQTFIKDVITRFSSNGSSLSHADASRWLSGLTPDGKISDDELKWIMTLGNKHTSSPLKQTGTIRKLELKDMELFPDALEYTMDSFITYVKNKPSIDGIFKEYDVDRNGTLTRDEVTSMLTTLNNGSPPEPIDMEFVISSADEIGDSEGIEFPELLQVLSAWYVRPSICVEEEKDEEETGGDDSKGGREKGSRNLSVEKDQNEGGNESETVSVDKDTEQDSRTFQEKPAVVAAGPACGQCSLQ